MFGASFFSIILQVSNTMNRKSIEVILVCLVTFITTAATNEDINIPCITPNGEQGECKAVYSCAPIFNGIQTKNQAAIKFAKASQCGTFGKTQSVCCGTVGYFQYDTDFLIDINKPKPSAVKEDESIKIVELGNFDSKELPDRSECGFDTLGNKIYGGDETQFDEFPWVVALEYKNNNTGRNEGVKCGGSLISKRFVLTAAHCLSGSEYQLMHVRIGEWDLTKDPDCADCNPVQIVKAEKEIKYPYYNIINKNNDIALIKLERDLEFNSLVRPVCLPPENLPAPKIGANLTICGWGSTDEGRSTSDIKLKVSVPLISNKECRKMLASVKIQANELCAGGERGKDACRGDSGGPLCRKFQDEQSNRLQWYQEGIVSRGVGCGLLGYPGIYTRISRYIRWIISNIES